MFASARLRAAQATEDDARLDGARLTAVAGVGAPALLRAQADPEVTRRGSGLHVVRHDGHRKPTSLVADGGGLGELRADDETLEVELLAAPRNENLHWSLH